MGAASSKIEDDKALQLCRERKKFVRQALDGRCALASTHVVYIHSLKTTGIVLRKVIQPDFPIESSLYTSTNATPEPLALTDKSYSHLSSPSPPRVGRSQVHHMNFRGSFVRKVEEKPPEVTTGTVTSLSTPQNTTPGSLDRTELSPSETPTRPHENSPWDYFGVPHSGNNNLSLHDQRELDHEFRYNDDLKHTKDDVEGEIYTNGSQGSDFDEFDDDPSSNTLVRKFKNLNRDEGYSMHTGGSIELGNELSDDEKVNSSSLKSKSLEPKVMPGGKVTREKEEDFEHKIAPKDFISSIREVEQLFVKASESGKEVPRMLEANKFHFRPLLPGRESGMSPTAVLKACFSCGEDPSEVQEEPAQTSVKYLTWHRTASFRSSSSRNFLDSHSREEVEDHTNDVFENMYMISGSHASTLDRLFAWEKKLYDEVKASQMVRREYDMKCKLLRQQETKCESQHRIDKTRAIVKDLYSRIRVAIHRIDSISRRIEELRDKELQPQLEELIEGLRKMWEVMVDCHKLQVHIITNAFSNGVPKLSLQSESQHHNALLLEDELRNLSSTFITWNNAITTYIQSINTWLTKCVNFQAKSSKKRKYDLPPHQRLRNTGPPIYTTCGAWLDSLQNLPVQKVVDSIKGLETEISHLVPNQERVHGKKTLDQGLEMQSHQSFEEWNSTGYDGFESSFVNFLMQICEFAEHSLKMYSELQINIEEAERNYEHKMSQP